MTLLIKGQKQIRNGYYTRERIGHSPTWVSGAARYRDNPSSISAITLSSQALLLRGSRDFESQTHVQYANEAVTTIDRLRGRG